MTVAELLEIHEPEFDLMEVLDIMSRDNLTCEVKPMPHERVKYPMGMLPPCSVEVTHSVGTRCVGKEQHGLSCRAIAEAMELVIASDAKFNCPCGKPVRECWWVRPI